ncbi:hypothetical protein [Streptomyces sp. YIM S03343]
MTDQPNEPNRLHVDLCACTTRPNGRPPLDFAKLARTLASVPLRPEVPRHPDEERRDRYATVIRENLKANTFPPTIPGGRPAFGMTEHELADVVLAERDDDLAQARAERDAALRLANVWADAPDPLAQAMAADLRTALRAARPSETAEATGPTTSDELRRLAERIQQLERALGTLRRFNALTVDSCRVQAAEHARDNLTLLDNALGTPPRPPHPAENPR